MSRLEECAACGAEPLYDAETNTYECPNVVRHMYNAQEREQARKREAAARMWNDRQKRARGDL